MYLSMYLFIYLFIYISVLYPGIRRSYLGFRGFMVWSVQNGSMKGSWKRDH